RGVRGINLDEGDDVIGVEIPAQGTFMLTISENGFGKCTPIDEYRVQTRGGKGTINLKTVAKIGNVSGVLQVQGEENIMLISNAGKVIRLKVQEVPVNHRVTQGVKLIDLEPEEKLVGVARTTSESEDKDDDGGGNGADETDATTEENDTSEE
ncbi:MAG: DNA gyrase subunit A, partial [Chloroflexi bacterium]|nr:DNA gyrase subunit A [Chloroflexota bacterium]